MAKNADELMTKMLNAIKKARRVRQVVDPKSPKPGSVVESCFKGFTLEDASLNVVTIKSIDLKWAVANTLHFMTGSEDAAILRKYNPHCDRFLDRDRFNGAYGAVGKSQVLYCIELINKDRHTRRASVTIQKEDAHVKANINIPPCPLCFHFMSNGSRLDMAVYQRSLNVWGVMPYDLLQFTNILSYVCAYTDFVIGSLHWFVGSLHVDAVTETRDSKGLKSLLIPPLTLFNARQALNDPKFCSYCHPFLTSTERT
jgi:thymidylate synthase